MREIRRDSLDIVNSDTIVARAATEPCKYNLVKCKLRVIVEWLEFTQNILLVLTVILFLSSTASKG